MISTFRILLAGVALTLAVIAAPARGDDTRLWQEGDLLMMEHEAWRGNVAWKLASQPSSTRLQGWEVKPRLQYRWHANLDSAVTYKLVRGRAGTEWATTQALEFDLTPSWNVSKHIRAHVTHRLGLVHPENQDLIYRYHLAPRIEWPTHWLPAQLAIDTTLEAVYDLGNGHWHETKFSPLRLRIAVGPSSAWFITYVLNHQRASPTSWRREHVLQVAVALDMRAL